MESTAVSRSEGAMAPRGAFLVLTIIGASVLCGVGILGMAYWLITLRWLYFLSVLALGLGAYLLFTRATGPDHA